MKGVPDYLEFYGLKDHPFRLTPDTKYFFPAQPHYRAFEILRYGIKRGEGFLVLTGKPGTGKTMLLRLLLKEDGTNKEIALLLSPTLPPKELLMALLEDLGIETRGENKEKLLKTFRDYLIKLAQEGKTLLLVIDEAQNLPIESLEELRLLSNLETEEKKLIQIILVGQPGLESKLNSPLLSQLLQRITIWEKLEVLSFEETIDYIQYRWQKAGGIFIKIDKRALKLIYKASKGIPRQINKIMDRTILFSAAERANHIEKRLVKAALESLNFSFISRKIWPWHLTLNPSLKILTSLWW